jgi:hypothetical protein
MKSNRRILFGILITLTVLFCFGAEAYSNPVARLFATDLPSGSHHDENNVGSDIDSFEDDQNYPVVECGAVVKAVSQMPVPRNFVLIHNFFLSYWQPPKIS